MPINSQYIYSHAPVCNTRPQGYNIPGLLLKRHAGRCRKNGRSSHDLRRNTECYLILEGGEPHKTLRFSGETIRSLNPDERSAGALIKKGLSTPAEPEFRKAADGIAIRSAGLAELLQEFSFAVLDENGKDIREAETLPENFILSDHMNFTEEEEELLKDLPRYSVGPRVLHADHTITVILNEFDRRERS